MDLLEIVLCYRVICQVIAVIDLEAQWPQKEACRHLKPASDTRLISCRSSTVAIVPSNPVQWPSHCKLTLLFKLKEGRG